MARTYRARSSPLICEGIIILESRISGLFASHLCYRRVLKITNASKLVRMKKRRERTKRSYDKQMS